MTAAQRQRLAVVTGGLGGLGTAICGALATAGRKVVAVDLANSTERIAAFEDAIRAFTAGSDDELQL